jgi:hypothetical protein
VGYWPLAGNALDYGSDGTAVNDLTAANNPVTGSGRYSETNGATEFSESSSQSLSKAAVPTTNTCDISLSTWVKPTALDTDGSNIFTIGASGGSGYSLFMNDSGKLNLVLGGVFADSNMSSVNILTSPSSWHHIAVTCKNVSQWILYADGKPINQFNATAIAPSGSITIGGSGNQYFSGSIADVRIYSRALNEGEINELAQDAEPSQVGSSYNTGAAGLLSHYGFDYNGTIPSLDDAGALGYALTNSSPAGGVVGKDGDDNGAYWFANENLDYTTPAGLPMGNSPSTLCAWIKPSTYPTTDYPYAAIVNYGSSSVDSQRRGLFLYRDTGGAINVHHDGFGTVYSHTVSHTVPLNTWTHLCASATPASTTEITSRIYVNGSEIGTATTLEWDTAAGQLRIGYGTEENYYFNGAIDDVRIYNNALTSDQIRQLAVQVPNGLVARYDFNDDDGATSKDEWSDWSGWGNPIESSPGSPIFAADRFGNANMAYRLSNVSNQYLAVADSEVLSQTGDMSISVWVNPASLPLSSGVYGIVSKMEASKGYALELWNDSGNQRLYFWDNGGANDAYSVPYSLPTGVYSHIVVSRSGTSTINFYVNGSPLGNSNEPTSFGRAASSNPLLIGTRNDNTETQDFNGSIDDVRIYNRELSGNEVRALSGYHPMQVGTALSNFRLHLQADSFSNLDEATPIANGTVWQDGSYNPLGSGTANVTATGPKYSVSDGINGHAAIRFTNSDQSYFAFGSPSLTPTNGLTLCGVYTVIGFSSNYPAIIEKRSGTASTTNFGLIQNPSGGTYLEWSNGSATNAITGTISNPTLTCVNASNINTSTANLDPLRVGSRWDAGVTTKYFDGNIGDLLLYTVPLTGTSVYGSGTDRDVVECYLSAKYGIEIGHSCP